jgi:hypothetical protein
MFRAFENRGNNSLLQLLTNLKRCDFFRDTTFSKLQLKLSDAHETPHDREPRPLPPVLLEALDFADASSSERHFKSDFAD